MNKLLKGAAAGAAGIALLAGGFGTYAEWTDTESVDAGTISSGTLTVDKNNALPVTWVDDNPLTGGRTSWEATDKMVPGDRVTFTQPLTINAVGKNLKAKVELTGMSSTAFASLNVSATLGGTPLTCPTSRVCTLSPQTAAALNGEKNLAITFAFPQGTTNLVDQGASLSLAGLGVVVTQDRS